MTSIIEAAKAVAEADEVLKRAVSEREAAVSALFAAARVNDAPLWVKQELSQGVSSGKQFFATNEAIDRYGSYPTETEAPAPVTADPVPLTNGDATPDPFDPIS